MIFICCFYNGFHSRHIRDVPWTSLNVCIRHISWISPIFRWVKSETDYQGQDGNKENPHPKKSWRSHLFFTKREWLYRREQSETLTAHCETPISPCITFLNLCFWVMYYWKDKDELNFYHGISPTKTKQMEDKKICMHTLILQVP